MPIVSETIQYQLGTAQVTWRGFPFSTSDLDLALSGLVEEVVFDDSGKADIQLLLAGIIKTESDKSEDNI